MIKESPRSEVEEAGKKLKTVFAVTGLEVRFFFERVVFNFLICKADAHASNYSVTYIEDAMARFELA